MSNFPEKISVRDTKLNDDLGGLGQRIFTTSGQGYEKQEYVRKDIFMNSERDKDYYFDELDNAINVAHMLVASYDNVRKCKELDKQIIELGKYIKNLQNQLKNSYANEAAPQCRHEMGG